MKELYKVDTYSNSALVYSIGAEKVMHEVGFLCLKKLNKEQILKKIP